MNLEITTSSYFDKEAKKLKKRYVSFVDDLEKFRDNLMRNPLQGTELSPGIRKIRFAIKSKGKGKAGCARVITVNALVSETEGKIILLLIYDKEDSSSVKKEVIKSIVKDLGLL
ncbi:MAG: addiction module toxin RelE [Prevotella sp.]|jgi:hypothetical protein|nr:addiction module toxin RelE [Prevotella sp.]MCH4018158.1 addiction module toxin RelE [Prevotella sp.]MCI1324100.1 addiction module toxin RelE [Prevotella sp.]MCI1348531.1 addiction module toxin RelE [Prevotella sp.]MCI1686391.1 addiction module toxin RelE [Prevotella sp.]MCI2138391.1 addiction module toxin RelE [Prevotella sp.]